MPKFIITVLGTSRVFECDDYVNYTPDTYTLINPSVWVSEGCVAMYEPKQVIVPCDRIIIEKL